MINCTLCTTEDEIIKATGISNSQILWDNDISLDDWDLCLIIHNPKHTASQIEEKIDNGENEYRPIEQIFRYWDSMAGYEINDLIVNEEKFIIIMGYHS